MGKQHVTLETNLTGKGEMVLTRPAEASARLIFPADLSAEILIHRTDDRTILAEAHKAADMEMGLAFPADDYIVLVRQDQQVRQCPVRLSTDQITTLNMRGCTLLEQDPVIAKHPAPSPSRDRFALRPTLELAVGGLVIQKNDAYLRTLDTFGYEATNPNKVSRLQLHYGALVGLQINRYLLAGAFYTNLDRANEWHYSYATGDGRSVMTWRAHRFGLLVRGSYPLLKDHLIPFAEAGIGASIAKAAFIRKGEFDGKERETHWGYTLSGSVGLIGMVYGAFGVLIQASYIFVPTLENLYNEKHNSGGFAFLGGVHIAI